MLTDFQQPNTIICLLCRGHVSVKEGDRTRFFHHISSSHEVHFDMDLLFLLSFMPEKDKKKVVDNINILMKHHDGTPTNEDDTTPHDDVDELLETDNEEDQISENEETNLEEPVVEPEVSINDAEIQDEEDQISDNEEVNLEEPLVKPEVSVSEAEIPDDLSSGILELKPTILELKQVRVEI